MKLKEILSSTLLTEGRSNSVSLEEAYEIYRNVPQTVRNKTPKVYRGKSGDNYLTIDPSQYVRVSENTHNHYTLWIDNRWPNKFPKRSRSIVCSNSRKTAEQFGTKEYVVIPMEESNFGVCPRRDIWLSFKILSNRYSTDLPGFFNGILAHFYNEVVGDEDEYITDESYQSMINDIRLLNDISEEEWVEYGNMEADYGYDNPAGWKQFSKDVIDYGVNKDIVGLIDKILDPEKNGFEVESYRSVPSFSEGGGNEVWTSNKCLMIEVEKFNIFFKE